MEQQQPLVGSQGRETGGDKPLSTSVVATESACPHPEETKEDSKENEGMSGVASPLWTHWMLLILTKRKTTPA